MTLASNQGNKSQVDEIVAGLTRSFTDWNDRSERYLAARAKIAALIAAD